MATFSEVLEGGLRGLAAGMAGMTRAKVQIAQAKTEQQQREAQLMFDLAKQQVTQQNEELRAQLAREGFASAEEQERIRAESAEEIARQQRLAQTETATIGAGAQTATAKIGAQTELTIADRNIVANMINNREERDFQKILQELKGAQALDQIKQKGLNDLRVQEEENRTKLSQQGVVLPTKFATAFGFVTSGMSKDLRVANANEVSRLLAAGQENEAIELITSLGVRRFGDRQSSQYVARAVMREQLVDIAKGVEELVAEGGKIGLLSGTVENMFAQLGKSKDPRLRNLATQMEASLQAYISAISGAQFSIQEVERYKAISPSILKGEELNLTLIDGLVQFIDVQQASFAEQALGTTGAELAAIELPTERFEPIGGLVAPDPVINNAAGANITPLLKSGVAEALREGQSPESIKAEIRRGNPNIRFSDADLDAIIAGQQSILSSQGQ